MTTKDSVLVRLPRDLVERWDAARGTKSRADYLATLLRLRDGVLEEVIRRKTVGTRNVETRFKGAKK